jgi:hypothetical protein
VCIFLPPSSSAFYILSSCLLFGPFVCQVRGPKYLSDHVKVKAGFSAYTLLAVDLVSTPTAVHHLARYLPSVRWVGWGWVGVGGRGRLLGGESGSEGEMTLKRQRHHMEDRV